MSDIGFGLERLNYDTEDISESDLQLNDYMRTISLLSLSGVVPSNNEHGYRFRLFSKKIVGKIGLNFTKLQETISNLDEYFEIWKNVKERDKTEAINIIKKECERNFNRSILNYLEQSGVNVDLNINQDTLSFFDQLRLTGVKDNDYWNSLKKKICL